MRTTSPIEGDNWKMLVHEKHQSDEDPQFIGAYVFMINRSDARTRMHVEM